ncbi:MAG: hypothetical protein CL878_12715 [Dehalococcoidia bacterium]|nr:hypothetical protein [Dehalococcoidia bacterium]
MIRKHAPRRRRLRVCSALVVALVLVLSACSRSSTSAYQGRDESGFSINKSIKIGTNDDPLRVIIDTDADPSDVLATLFLLQSKSADVLAITVTGAGFMPQYLGVPIMSQLTKLAGQQDVPVAYGAAESSAPVAGFPEAWVQPVIETFSQADMPTNETRPVRESSAQLIVDTVRASEEKVSLLELAPATNIADALRLDPALADNVEQVIFSGGAFEANGNVLEAVPPNLQLDTASHRTFLDEVQSADVAEYNAFLDAPALSRLLQSPTTLVFSPLDASDMAPVTRETVPEDALESGSPAAQFAAQVIDPQLQQSDAGDPIDFWDPVAASLLVSDVCNNLEHQKVTVTTQNTPAYGQTASAQAGDDSLVCMSIDPDAFFDVIFGTLLAW